MKVKTLQGGLKKATIEMVLLRLLTENDKYGYQMSQECKKRSNGKYTILEGSMYPILYRLEDAKYISSYEKKVGLRLTRVYYHLEDAGKEHLQLLYDEFDEYIQIIYQLLQGAGLETAKKEDPSKTDAA